MILFRTLGPVEVSVEGAPAPPELLWRKNLALLVYLAYSPKRARTRDHLVGLLWGDKPESAARHSLNEAVRVLRKYAGEGGVESEGGQIRLADDAVQQDTQRFETLVEAEDWRGAAELIAGEFLEGFFVPGSNEFDNWLYGERQAWRQRSVDVLVKRAEQLLTGGDVRDAAAIAHRASALDSTSDVVARLAMRSAALSGDRAAALAIFEAFAARLEEEIGIEPDDETRVLAERVRHERMWRLPQRAPEAEEVGAESRRAPLVGREAELEALVGAWEACRSQERATLGVIEGDPGTGGTRLAEELLARARLDGAAVAALRAVPADLDDEWSGVVALARGGLLEALELQTVPAPALAAFAARLPDWAERVGDQIDECEPAPLTRALVDVMRAVTAEQPLLLLMDDAQWLDRDSLLAIGAVMRDLANSPLFVAVTTTPHAPRSELDELRARIGRDLAGVAVSMSPLSVEALRALARWALPGYSEVELDRVTRRVATDSAGLPFLAVELLHAVALGLDLGRLHGAWPEPFKTMEQTLPSDLPDAVVAAIRVGFRRLSPEAQRALPVAAVLGDRVAPDLLARATGLGAEELAAALDELEWQRWLAAEPRGYSFVARLVREVIGREMVTAGQRRRILEMAAEPAAPA